MAADCMRRNLLEARSGSGWRFYREATGISKHFTEARWWELTILPMGAYLLWAVLYYVKVCSTLLIEINGDILTHRAFYCFLLVQEVSLPRHGVEDEATQ